MKHLKTHSHAFIKNGYIYDIFAFDEDKHNHPILDEIVASIGAEQVVCLCDYYDRTGVDAQRYWQWDGTNFTEPTMEFLLSLGVIDALPAPISTEEQVNP